MSVSHEYAVETLSGVKTADDKSEIDSRPTSRGAMSCAAVDAKHIESSNDNANDKDRLAGQTDDAEAAPYSVFSAGQKRFIVLMVAIAGFFSPLSANIYFPALNTLATQFHVSSAVINLTLTSYMIFQGLAPTLVGDLADMAGRRPAYIIGFAIYIGACIGIACCDSYAALLVLRCLQSTGSSGTIALGSGVVADIAVSAERGVWMGWATSGPMTASAIAPVLGGILTEFAGWRWVFWFLVILSSCYLAVFLVTFPETGRRIVGAGDIPPQSWNMSVLNYMHYRRARQETCDSGIDDCRIMAKPRALHFPNPMRTVYVILEKDVALLLFYNALIYCAFYCVIASFPNLLNAIYGFNALQIGLSFLPYGAGCLIAPYTVGKLMDWNFRRVAHSVGYAIVPGRANDLRNFPLERTRIQVALPLIVVGNAALLCYGWVMYAETSLAAPLVLHFIMGVTLTGAFNVMSVMLIDLYPLSPATATAANNLVRCLMGAGATALIDDMIVAMGRGWCFTFVAGVVAVFSPILALLQRYGPAWRAQRHAKVEARQAADEEKSRHDVVITKL